MSSVEYRASSVESRASSGASSFAFIVSCCAVSRRVAPCRPAHTYQEDVEKFQGGSAAGATSTGAPAPAAPAEYEDVPTSNMRRTIGKRLTESKQQVPHYYLTVEINMGE